MSSDTSLAGQPAEAAIPRLLEEHGGRILGLGLRMCGDRAAAEDLVQETFLQAYRKWEQFEGRSQPSTWLYTIAARICRRSRRRRSGEPRRLESLAELLPAGESTAVEIPSPEEGPLDEQLRKEGQRRLEAALAALPYEFRVPVVLKDIAELSVAEVAKVLGLKEATVKTRVHRARLALRRELARGLPRRAAARADHSQQVCLDLLAAKQEALDRREAFPVSADELCSRCRSLFSTLDLTTDICHQFGEGPLPPRLRRAVLERLGK